LRGEGGLYDNIFDNIPGYVFPYAPEVASARTCRNKAVYKTNSFCGLKTQDAA
jgi:hypothetical protein|tara:strand:+ start:1996 stop:2154 length:159 start_codon:yes stop_codon:yes gene_type:complete